MIIKDPKTGEDMEVFTGDEVRERENVASTSAVDKFKEANPDKSGEITNLTKAKEELESKLADATKLNAAGGQDDKIVELTAQLKKNGEETRAYIDEKLTGRDTKSFDANVETALNAAANGDDERRKVLKVRFDDYRAHDTSEAGIAERMAVAVTLTDGKAPSPSALEGGGSAMGGRGTDHAPKQSDAESVNSKAIGTQFGVTDKDREAADQFKTDRAAGIV